MACKPTYYFSLTVLAIHQAGRGVMFGLSMLLERQEKSRRLEHQEVSYCMALGMLSCRALHDGQCDV